MEGILDVLERTRSDLPGFQEVSRRFGNLSE